MKAKNLIKIFSEDLHEDSVNDENVVVLDENNTAFVLTDVQVSLVDKKLVFRINRLGAPASPAGLQIGTIGPR